MSESKWLTGLHEDMPVVAAAQLVLSARLESVRERLPQAVSQADADPEHVHQLRVSTRRAAAALRIFKACLPDKKYKTIRNRLRALRRAAGAARDWDVFLLGLAQRQRRAPAAHKPGLDVLAGIGHGQRMNAQETLLHATRQPLRDFAILQSDTVAALQLPEDVPATYTLGDLAIPLLTEHLRLLDEGAQGDLLNYEHLHQVRIRGKRLRYAMEVFASCFKDSFQDKYYPAIEAMQDMLGDANDSHVAAQRLEAIRARIRMTQPRLWPRYQPGVEALLHYHERALPRKRRQFTTWWREWQQSGAEEAFARLLKTSGS